MGIIAVFKHIGITKNVLQIKTHILLLSSFILDSYNVTSLQNVIGSITEIETLYYTKYVSMRIYKIIKKIESSIESEGCYI